MLAPIAEVIIVNFLLHCSTNLRERYKKAVCKYLRVLPCSINIKITLTLFRCLRIIKTKPHLSPNEDKIEEDDLQVSVFPEYIGFGPTMGERLLGEDTQR